MSEVYQAWDPNSLWDAQLPHITAEAVREALERFPMPMAGGKDWPWLALAVRRSLAFSIPNRDNSPDRQPNADTRKELERLAKRCGKLWIALFDGRSQAVEDAVFDGALRRWVAEVGEGAASPDGIILGDPTDWRRFNAAINELDWLSGFLRSIAREVPSQKPRWTEAEWRRVRLRRALCLAPVFLAAFRAKSLPGKVFGDFYQRMVDLAFAEGDIPDFESLIGDARQLHQSHPTTFDPDFIPGL